MIPFLFASLSSMVFWAGYIIVTLFAGTLLMRLIAPKTYRFVTSGAITRDYHDDGSDSFDLTMMAIIIYLFWPIIAACVLIYWIFAIAFGVIIGPAIRKLIVLVDKSIPHIEIRKKESY